MLQIGQIEIALYHQHAGVHDESAVAHENPNGQLGGAEGDAGSEHRDHAHRGAEIERSIHIVSGTPPGARGNPRRGDDDAVTLSTREILKTFLEIQSWLLRLRRAARLR